MEIKLNQEEITVAVAEYLMHRGYSSVELGIPVVFTQGRGPTGLSAELVIIEASSVVCNQGLLTEPAIDTPEVEDTPQLELVPPASEDAEEYPTTSIFHPETADA